jgi:hypothetical protein
MSNDIKYIVVDKFDHQLLSEAARLHIEHLSYRSFITLFGNKFMVELYKDILADKLGFFIFALEDGHVCGFVLGCINSKQLFNIIARKFIKYFMIIFPRIILNPQIIPKLFETLFYVNKENTNVESELIVIVTDINHRSTGVGKQLVSVLDQEFLKHGVHQYKVTVHDEMKKSNNFYVKNGMKLSANFMMYGVKWNMYINQLE